MLVGCVGPYISLLRRRIGPKSVMKKIESAREDSRSKEEDPEHIGMKIQTDQILGEESFYEESWKFCKSGKTNIDEMAKARGLTTKLTFIKPPGYKYKLG